MMDESNTNGSLRSKRKSSPRSIDHGSSDYLGSNDDNHGSFGSSSNSFGSVNLNHNNNTNNNSLLVASTPDSNGSHPNEGLHHRHPHRFENTPYIRPSAANSSNINTNTNTLNSLLPHPPSNSKLSSLKRTAQSSILSSPKIKRILSWIAFPVILCGYVLLNIVNDYYHHDAYHIVEKEIRDEGRHELDRWNELSNGRDRPSYNDKHGDGNNIKYGGHGSSSSSWSERDMITSNVNTKTHPLSTKGQKSIYSSNFFSRRTLSKNSDSSMTNTLDSQQEQDGRIYNSDYSFDPRRQSIHRYELTTDHDAQEQHIGTLSAWQRADQWLHLNSNNVGEQLKGKRMKRRERTSYSLSLSNNHHQRDNGIGYTSSSSHKFDLDDIGAVKTSQSDSLLPLWYELNHLTTDTMSLLYDRWKQDDDTATSGGGTDNLDSSTFNDAALPDDFPLCGRHAQNAAELHPQNYYPSNSTTHFHTHHNPLGPDSRVLITGILSPMGMHLSIALARQCNITNFLGIDTQMPNDPLSRLEQQERLAVLMEELSDFKTLQVPFLGVQSKQRGRKSPRQEKEGKAREDALMNLYQYGTLPVDYSNLPMDRYRTTPQNTYGIPHSPGIHPSGFGALEIVLEYRPTHIVHLAGSQSESFTSAKDVNYAYPTEEEGTFIDEDEVILKESISYKPYMYELRMGMTGMEQLLSAIVAQSVLPLRYGKDYEESQGGRGRGADEVKKLSSDDLNKMKRPHFVYASSYDAGYFGDSARRVNQKGVVGKEGEGYSNSVNDGDFREGKEDLGSLSPSSQVPPRGLNGVSRLIDEVLASTYRALHGVSSIGLRFDAIFGPRGFGVPSTSVPIYNIHRIRRGGVSSDVDLAETAVRRLYRQWVGTVKKNKENEEDGGVEEAITGATVESSLIEEAGWLHAAHDPRDFVFVEDAVEAIISAMQYRAVKNSPTIFHIGSGEMSTLSSLSEEIENLSSDESIYSSGRHTSAKNVIDVELSSAARSVSLASKEYLQWSSSTTMQEGAAKTLAWHLDRALPFFPPSIDGSLPMDGEDILSRSGITSCLQHSTPSCLRESPPIPCSSECSTKTCVSSVFDDVLELSREVSEDCEAVLYTTSLGYNVQKLSLQTQYSDGKEQKKNNEATLCTIAFVPSESKLVRNVIAKVPPDSLRNMNLELSGESDYETKVKNLSGHLVHQGWLLIFVDGAIEPLTAEDIFMPKLTPRRLFHPSVRRAMFVDENFPSTPMPDDALFLASEMSRGKLKKRTVMGPNEVGKKIKYKLPEEPPRKAVMMVAPMRNLPKVDSHQMPLRQITKHLLKEVGANEDDFEPKEVRVQREFYERARSLINSFDLRSLDDIAHHRIQIKDFIRSRWVLHDLKEEEGHQLRCEWYREHVRWNTHLDQISFAYVMAKRELTRKVITEQPLQTELEKKTLLQMVIDAKSDAKEWYPIFSGEGTTLPIHHSQIAPEAIPQNLQDQHEITNEDIPESTTEDDSSNTFYVRIMSDERMVEARKSWSKARQFRLQRAKTTNISPDDKQR